MPEDPDDPASLVGLLAEETRLRVFAAVVLGAGSVDDVVGASGLDRRVVVTALERLAGRGMVTTDEQGRLLATAEKFKQVARRIAAEQRARQKDTFDHLPADAAAVLRNFIREGQLVRIPAARSKRLIVLDWLAGRFDVGQTYSEARVNLILGLVYDDVAALRRYLVDEGFLERREGFYWRAGGPMAAAVAQGAAAAALVLFSPGVTDDGTLRFGRMGDASTPYALTPGFPPTLIVHGTNDEVVPIAAARLLRAALAAAGAHCELAEFSGASHEALASGALRLRARAR